MCPTQSEQSRTGEMAYQFHLITTFYKKIAEAGEIAQWLSLELRNPPEVYTTAPSSGSDWGWTGAV